MLSEKAVNRGYFFAANQQDGNALRRGRVCYTTSWVTGYKTIQGVHTICHTPSKHFVTSIPADTCILFPIDDSNFSSLHNFCEVDGAELAKTKWIKVLS